MKPSHHCSQSLKALNLIVVLSWSTAHNLPKADNITFPFGILTVVHTALLSVTVAASVEGKVGSELPDVPAVVQTKYLSSVAAAADLTAAPFA